MSAVTRTRPPESVAATSTPVVGRWAAWGVDRRPRRAVALTWVLLAVGLGALAPRAEHALSGAGWEASGSESVDARRLVQENFGGLSSQAFMVVVHSDKRTTADPVFQAVLRLAVAELRASDDVTTVVAPEAGATISRDGRTAVVTAGRAGRRPRPWRRPTI